MKQRFLAVALAAMAVGCAPSTPTQQLAPVQEVNKPVQNRRPTTVAVDCGSLTTQGEMNECFKREADHVEQLLGALLNDIGNVLDAAETDRLQDVQLQWTTYRDAHCGWQAAFFEGGSIQPTMYSTCISELTWNRIEEVKINLCEGYGMTGPCEASRRYDRPGLPSR